MRCWIDKDGVNFFWPGKIGNSGADRNRRLHLQSCQKNGIVVQKGLEMVDGRNKKGQQPLVILRKGVEKGSGAEITTSGKKILADYRRFTQKLQSILEQETGILELI